MEARLKSAVSLLWVNSLAGRITSSEQSHFYVAKFFAVSYRAPYRNFWTAH